MVVRRVKGVLDGVLLESPGPHPRLGARYAKGGREEDSRTGEQRGGLRVETVGVLEAAHSLGQRLPDRGRLARVGDDIRVAGGSGPDGTANLAVGHPRLSGILARAGQAAADEDLHVVGPGRELGERRLVELPLPGGVCARRSLAVAAPGRDRPARAENARRGEPAALHRGAQQQVGAILLVNTADRGDAGPQRVAGPGR